MRDVGTNVMLTALEIVLVAVPERVILLAKDALGHVETAVVSPVEDAMDPAQAPVWEAVWELVTQLAGDHVHRDAITFFIRTNLQFK